MNIQDRLVIYRAKHRLTQKEMAERCGLSVMTISSVENGIQEPTRLTRAKIELVIGEEEADAAINIKD